MLAGILGYVCIPLLIGVYLSRRIGTEEDYFVAGRGLGTGLATFSIFATWFGAETCISAAGGVYQNGLSSASAEPFGYGVCILIMGLFLAIPLWKQNLTTLGDLFRRRFSPGVEKLAVLLLVPTSLLWAAAQLRAFGQVLDASTGMGFLNGLILGGCLTILYTSFGGLRADVYSDFIQALVIIIGLGAVMVGVLNTFPSTSAAWKSIDSSQLQLVNLQKQPLLELMETWAVPICGSLMVQELVARVIATRSPGVARRASLAGGSLYLLIGLIPVFIGLLGPKIIPNLAEPEQILPRIAREHLAPFFYVMFAGALVSAILSTVDSTLLAAAALISHNVIVPLRPGLTEKQKLKTARCCVVGGGILAALLALQAETIYELVENASSFGSSGILIAGLFGLFTRWGHAASAWVAMIGGTIAWVAAKMIGSPYPYLFSLAVALCGYLLIAAWSRKGAELKPHGPVSLK